MATTGFWPVHGDLKSVIDYAENPSKTTDPKYLDDDLLATLSYAKDEKKTDQTMYVSGINCSKHTAYHDMLRVKKRYRKSGGNIAYHGYQSFVAGEVTPKEAHEIGVETARRMWGERFQVIVTTHLNTENIHNHFVVNSVSFKDGKKFRNQIGDRHELRKISDEICREHGKSVLEGAPFYGGEKDDYWVHQTGRKTHRDILKEDMEYCLQYSRTLDDFILQLKGLGYELDRTRMSVRAKGWKKAVRLQSLGFDTDTINRCWECNWSDNYFRLKWNAHLPKKPKYFPLESELRRLDFSLEHAYKTETILVDTVLYLLISIIIIAMKTADWMLLSPDIRAAARDIKDYIHFYNILKDNNIRTRQELLTEISSAKAELKCFEDRRDKLSNKIRRATNTMDKAEYKELRKDISRQMKPIRERLRRLQKIDEKAEIAYGLLRTEHRLEEKVLSRAKERNR